MSRSYKKAVGKIGSNSEKIWKRFWHKKLRHSIKQLLHNGEEDNFPNHKNVSDIWCSPSDGKMFYLTPDDDFECWLSEDGYFRKYFKKNKKWMMYK